jgi:hypothetical protein
MPPHHSKICTLICRTSAGAQQSVFSSAGALAVTARMSYLRHLPSSNGWELRRPSSLGMIFRSAQLSHSQPVWQRRAGKRHWLVHSDQLHASLDAEGNAHLGCQLALDDGGLFGELGQVGAQPLRVRHAGAQLHTQILCLSRRACQLSISRGQLTLQDGQTSEKNVTIVPTSHYTSFTNLSSQPIPPHQHQWPSLLPTRRLSDPLIGCCLGSEDTAHPCCVAKASSLLLQPAENQRVLRDLQPRHTKPSRCGAC